MEISFKNRKLEKLLSDKKSIIRKWGELQGKKIMQRIYDLLAADNLEILRTLPQMRAHELKGNRKGQISIDVMHPYRLIIVPDYNNPPRKEDGGLDWKRITKIKILEIEDTHD